MLIILSPAKTMDMSPVPAGLPVTEPEFRNDAELLAAKMRRYTQEEIAVLLKISPKLARENYMRYQQFDAPDNPIKQALFAYNGSVFKHIQAGAFSVDDLEYAQNHLRIVSTLYGLLRPLDRIKAYRMTYDVKLQGMTRDLYAYWRPVLTDPLIAAVNSAGGLLVNLASLDVLGAFDMARVRQQVRVVTPEFLMRRNGRWETVRTYAKIARGEMTRFILQQRIEQPDQLKTFVWEDFCFNEALSDEVRYVFTRK